MGPGDRPFLAAIADAMTKRGDGLIVAAIRGWMCRDLLLAAPFRMGTLCRFLCGGVAI